MGKVGEGFKGKVVLITGASSGIGAALASEFARLGASLSLAARRKEQLEALAREIQDAGGVALAVECDVTKDGDSERAVAQTLHKFGRLDVVIANAGFGVVGEVESLKLEDYRRQFETNVFGVLRTVHAALPELKKTRGRLALMGSVAGYVSLPHSSPYSMSKFCVRALAEALIPELKPCGVSVTLISPGFVKSEIRRVDNRGKLHETEKTPLPSWLPMETDVAARKMCRAIALRRREEIITLHGKCAVFLQRHFPWVLNWFKARGLASRSEP